MNKERGKRKEKQDGKSVQKREKENQEKKCLAKSELGRRKT